MGSTILEYFSEHSGYRCGYCGGTDTNFSHGMWAHSMTCQDYEDLICRGWRRSGKYCYKPTMDKTCCPHYTIRCLVENFKLTKSQKNTLKHVHKYFNDGTKPGEQKSKKDDGSSSPMTESSNSSISGQGAKMETSAADKKESHEPKQAEGPDPNKPKCRKAKEIRKEKALQKATGKVKAPVEAKNKEKTIHDFVSELKPNGAHKLEIKLVRSNPRSEEFNRTFKDEFRVYKKYQTVIHKDEPTKVTEKQFTRFLIDSPLDTNEKDDALEHGYGSFHQQYWIDGQLWMVGVLDILPHATSSVYLFYDPDFSFLSPGTYSALREIEFTQNLHQKQPQIYSYMMGYYIHTCPKMKYKGQYFPSYLLCPEVNTWHPIAECQPKLDVSKYSRFAASGDKDPDFDIDIEEILVLHEGSAMPYKVYKMIKSMKGRYKDDSEEVREYAGLVGRTCAERMLLYRS